MTRPKHSCWSTEKIGLIQALLVRGMWLQTHTSTHPHTHTHTHTHTTPHHTTPHHTTHTPRSIQTSTNHMCDFLLGLLQHMAQHCYNICYLTESFPCYKFHLGRPNHLSFKRIFKDNLIVFHFHSFDFLFKK